ncbi:MAG: hypothetical protein EAZ07_03240 [Cytophagales bacterium]|nr:MAG: hypothetical protein EAZ07_03240 [Cytophagales bacterium]
MKIMCNWFSGLSEELQIAIAFSIVLPSCIATIHFLFKANRDFFKLLNEFQEKLPPRHKRAKENLEIIPYMKVVDTTNMKMNLTTQEIDLFLKKLETFNYIRIVFKRKQIQSYSNNIQRLIRTAAWEKFGIAMIQSILEDDSFQRSKPYLFGNRIGKIIGF